MEAVRCLTQLWSRHGEAPGLSRRPSLIVFCGRVAQLLRLLPLLVLSGCVYGLYPYNTPSQQKLVIQTPSPSTCVIQVSNAQTIPAAADGRVTIDIPRLPRGCDIYLFGMVKIKDGNPENVRAVHVLRDGKVVRKLSLSELGRLPVDVEGYHILTLK